MYFHAFILLFGIAYCLDQFDLRPFYVPPRAPKKRTCARGVPLIFLPVVIKVFRWPLIGSQNETKPNKTRLLRRLDAAGGGAGDGGWGRRARAGDQPSAAGILKQLINRFQ